MITSTEQPASSPLATPTSGRRRAAIVAVYVAGLAAFAGALARSTPAVNHDNYAYLAWGQQLARGVTITVVNALATPHPLPIAFSAIISRLGSPVQVWTVVAAVSIATMVAMCALAAWRRAGWGGATLAIAMLVASGGLADVAWSRSIDLVSAASITIAMALPRRHLTARVILIAIAGLVRPEPWVLAGVLVLLDYEAPLRRRLLAAIGASALAPVVWATFDAIVAHDPLLAMHRTDALVPIAQNLTPLRDAPRAILATLDDLATKPALVFGGIAILLALYRFLRHRQRPADALPLLVAVVLPLAMVLEIASHDYPLRNRYLLPSGAALVIEGAVAMVFFGRFCVRRGFTSRFWLRAIAVMVITANIAIAASATPALRDVVLEQTASGGATLARQHLTHCRRILVLGGGIRDVKLVAPISLATKIPLERFIWVPPDDPALPAGLRRKGIPPGDAALTTDPLATFPAGMVAVGSADRWRAATVAGGCGAAP